MDNKTRETLEKQLQLLSERSQNAVDGQELASITDAMIEIIQNPPFSGELTDSPICEPPTSNVSQDSMADKKKEDFERFLEDARKWMHYQRETYFSLVQLLEDLVDFNE